MEWLGLGDELPPINHCEIAALHRSREPSLEPSQGRSAHPLRPQSANFLGVLTPYWIVILGVIYPYLVDILGFIAPYRWRN